MSRSHIPKIVTLSNVKLLYSGKTITSMGAVNGVKAAGRIYSLVDGSDITFLVEAVDRVNNYDFTCLIDDMTGMCIDFRGHTLKPTLIQFIGEEMINGVLRKVFKNPIRTRCLKCSKQWQQ